MISLFNAKARKEEVLTKNGIILDPICKSMRITEELNGEYSLEAEFIIDKNLLPLEIYNEIVEDYILRVPDEMGEEVFRIASVRKTRKSIIVYARQITIADTLNLWLTDVRPTNQSGNGALNWIFTNATGDNEFIVYSDITKNTSATYEGMSVYEAIGTAENSFLDRWGGEIIRRGYNLTINAQRGSDKGFKIISRKNLQGFEAKTNIDSLVTVIYPKGYDGIKAEAVKSPYYNNYSKPYPKEIKYDGVKVKDENNEEGFDTLAEAQAELKRLCELEFTENKRDIITATYNIKYAEIEKTEEYKELGITEKALLGDAVEVYEETHNINIHVKAIARIYDVLKQKREETTLSNMDIKLKPPTINDILGEINKGNEGNANLSDYINSMINAGLKDSYVVLKPNELLIMDNKDINLAVNVCRYNKNGMAFSQNGYYGKYTFGFTIDGVINASLIGTGTLLADLIKAGVLRSFNGKTFIDMENGTFNFYDKIKFDGTNFTIDLSGEDLATNSDVNAQFEIVNNAIKQKVSNTEYESYKTQTATTISQKVAKGTEFATEFNQNAEGFNFSLGNGNMNVNMTKDELGIKNGRLTVTNSNSQVVIDGQYNIHKIISTGILSCHMPSGVSDRNFTINHNLGYHPHTSCSQLKDGEATGVPLPAFSVYGAGGTLGYSTLIRSLTTTSDLIINIIRNSTYTTQDSTIKVRYFIYKEVAF